MIVIVGWMMDRIDHPILKSFIFVHAMIDEAGLSANEFRVYAHLARRAGKGDAFPAVASIAEFCHIHKDTVWAVLRSLESRGMLVRISRTGASNVYRLTEPGQWTCPSDSATRKEGAPETEGWGVAENKGCHPPETEGHEVTPAKAIPLRKSKEGNPKTREPKATYPTEDEWVAYCRQTWPNWYTSADAWVRYEANGWMMGKTKIKSWKAAARICFTNAKAWDKLGKPESEHDAMWRRINAERNRQE